MTEHDPRGQYDTYAVQARVAARRVARADDPWNVPVEGEGAQNLPRGACNEREKTQTNTLIRVSRVVCFQTSPQYFSY